MELSVKHVTKRFDGVIAAEDVSFDVERGHFLTLLGPSGSGKTTMLRCVAGVETPDIGTIQIGDKLVFSKKDGVNVPPEQRGLGMVYQSYALWPHMSVYDNVAYPLRVRGTTDRVGEKVESVLSMLKMNAMAKRYPHQLSGGEQQRVALARALVYGPELLLLDEPFSNLDTPLRERLRDELKMIQQETGVTTVYVTHHRIEASSMSDEIVILFSGRVSAVGTPLELLEHPPNPQVASFLGGLLVLEGIAHVSSGSRTVVDTPFGELEVSTPGIARDGQRVEVYVKPNLTRLARDGEGTNIIRGRVVGLTREIGLLEYRVEVGDQIIRVPHDLNSDWSPALREPVFVVVPPAAWIIAAP